MKLLSLLLIYSILFLTVCAPEKTEPKNKFHSQAVETVMGLCKAREELSAEKMEKYIADDFHSFNPDGSWRLYNREKAKTMCKWERIMNTRWTHEILGVNDSIVTVLLKEKNDYFTLLGLGGGIQVSEYIVVNGKVGYWNSKLYVTENGSQDEAFYRFRIWLLSQHDLNEPTLVRQDSTIIFNGESAPRMLYWLNEWRKFLNTNSSI